MGHSKSKRGKFIAVQAYVKKEGKAKISDLNAHLKHLENQQQINPVNSRRKKKIKTREKSTI